MREDDYRRERNSISFDPGKLNVFPAERGPWFEHADEVEAGLAWGRDKARLLRWIRAVMDRRLSARERAAIEQYYFAGQTYREAGSEMNRNASSVHRAVRRALHKLRAAAEEEGVTLRQRHGKRRRQRG